MPVSQLILCQSLLLNRHFFQNRKISFAAKQVAYMQEAERFAASHMIYKKFKDLEELHVHTSSRAAGRELRLLVRA